MIVPNSTEDDILRELLDDHASIQRKAKRLADKEIARLLKTGRGHTTTTMSHYVRSKNGNKWHLLIVCHPNDPRAKWIHCEHCIVELEQGRRDIYYLRGLRFGQPYFVKIYSHALRRMRERFCPKEGNELETNPDVMVDKVAFHPSEQGVYQRLTDPKYLPIIEESDDRSEVAGIALTRAAAFVAYRSDKGNYLFKTFFGNEQMQSRSKSPLYYYLMLIYCNLNPREMADMGINFSKIPLANQLAAMEEAHPELKEYIDTAGQGLHILYL